MKTETWNAVIDENTCDECRALHGKPISEIGMIPPLHGTHDPQGRTPCRCTIQTEEHNRLKSQYLRQVEYAARHF